MRRAPRRNTPESSGDLLQAHGRGSPHHPDPTAGRDFLLKIWNLLLTAPLGIAIIHEGMPPATVANIFFELGMMQAYGKELLVVKTRAAVVPSDLVRTEYLEWGPAFGSRLRRFMNGLLERAQYYETVAEQPSGSWALSRPSSRSARRRSAKPLQTSNRKPLTTRGRDTGASPSLGFRLFGFPRVTGAGSRH